MKFKHPISDLLVLLDMITIAIQLYSLNCALYYSSPILVIPLFYTFYTVFSFVNIAVYMHTQLNSFSIIDTLLITMGICWTLLGTWLLGFQSCHSLSES